MKILNWKKRKAAIHTVEATIATLMVLGFIIIAMPALIHQDTTETTKAKVNGALNAIENSGDLRPAALSGNMTQIKDDLETLLPANINFTVGLCTTYTNNCTILETPPNWTSIAAVSRIVVGLGVIFQPTEVVVYFW